MATLTIKNIPPELVRRLKDSAALNRRSMNREAILCLEKSLRSSRIDPESFLSSVRELRRKLERVHVTDRDLRHAKQLGRL